MLYIIYCIIHTIYTIYSIHKILYHIIYAYCIYYIICIGVCISYRKLYIKVYLREIRLYCLPRRGQFNGEILNIFCNLLRHFYGKFAEISQKFCPRVATTKNKKPKTCVFGRSEAKLVIPNRSCWIVHDSGLYGTAQESGLFVGV